MRTYIVLAQPGTDIARVKGVLDDLYAGSTRELRAGVWLLRSDDGTSKDVSDKIGFKNGGIGGGVIMATAGYFGFWQPDLWEWLAAQQGAPNA